MENVGKVVVFCPTLNMRDEWIQRLEKRYNHTLLDKDYRALMRARDCYSQDIIDLIECGLPIYQPAAIDYDLLNYVNRAWRDWCEKKDKEYDSGAYSTWSLPLLEAKIYEVENRLSILEDIYKNGKPKMLDELELLYRRKKLRQGGNGHEID